MQPYGNSRKASGVTLPSLVKQLRASCQASARLHGGSTYYAEELGIFRAYAEAHSLMLEQAPAELDTTPTAAANPLTASQSSKRHRAKISSWDHSKGFGFLRHQGKDLFLHRRDFSEHHKKPAPGDLIHYELGKDTEGRPCAVRALHHNDGGRLTLASILLLAALLILPSLALFYLYTTSDHIQKWLFVIPLGASFITYYLYALDKKRARSKQWRISENSLHFMELIGGWPGAFIAQKKLRHKCAKGTYQIIYHIIIIAHQYIWLDYLTNWQISQMIMASLTKNP